VPILPPQPIVNQVLPSGQLPYVQQQNFGQMVGETLDANPDQDPESVKVKINGIIRKIYDRRTWYGLMVRGQIATTGFTIGGQVAVTLGSPIVQGTGTTWTSNLIGRQFRIGYNSPPYTIIALDPVAQQLTLEMPWASPSITNGGYFIAQYYYSPGPNIKYIHTCRNLIMAWRLRLDLNQQSLDQIDPWRINTFSPWALAQLPPGVNGEYMVELYPVPSIVQPLPFIAVVQPPNLVNDNDTIPAYIRTDIVTKLSIADAKVYRGPKINKYYDMVESQRLRGEAETELQYLASKDEDLYRQDLRFEFEAMPEFSGSAAGWSINHGVAAGNNGWDW
jgi:hypothetical protein